MLVTRRTRPRNSGGKPNSLVVKKKKAESELGVACKRKRKAVGMVAAEPDATPFGKRYEISGVGEAYLEAWADSLAAYRDEVDFFLGLQGGPPVLAGCGSRAAV